MPGHTKLMFNILEYLNTNTCTTYRYLNESVIDMLVLVACASFAIPEGDRWSEITNGYG